MASVLNLIRLLKDQSPIGEECTLCDNVFELGDAAQIFGRGDSLKAYCLDCQEEKAEEKGLEIRIHEGKGSTSTTEKKSRKEGKKTRKKTERNEKINRGEKKLEVTPTSLPSKTEEEEEEVEWIASGVSSSYKKTELLTADEIVDLVQAGMDKLKVHFDKVLEDAFQFLQNPANGEFPEFPIGSNTLIRKIAQGIIDDQHLLGQLQLKEKKIVTHSLPEEQLGKCPASTASGSACQNKPKAGMVYCGSHKAHEDYDHEEATEELNKRRVKKEEKKVSKKKNLADQLGI